MILAYDLLEERRIIDFIITMFFSLCFKTAESFENLDNILHNSTQDNLQNSLAEAFNRIEKKEKEKKYNRFF